MGNKDIKIKLSSFKNSKHINVKGDGPYRGFGHFSLFSDPVELTTYTVILHLSTG